MGAYALQRLAGLIPVLGGISLLVFLMLRFIPGDPAIAILGERSTPAQRERIREQLGLQKPRFLNFEPGHHLFDSQYATFLHNLAQGDLGRSIIRRTHVRDELWVFFPATIELSLAALTIATLMGITLGIFAALHRGSWFDAASMGIALLGISLPIFWLGLMLQYLFGVYLGILPISQRIDPHIMRGMSSITGLYIIDGILMGRPDVVWDALRHLILPAITLASVPLASIARMTRAAVVAVLNHEYIRTARAKGLRASVVVLRHVLSTAMLPIVTIIGLQFGILLAGALLTETVFSWPGIGTWILRAVFARDYPVVQGGVMVIATTFVLINTGIDLLCAWLDPRIRERVSER